MSLLQNNKPSRMEGHTPFLRLAGLAALLLAAAMLMFSCTGGTEGGNTSDSTDAVTDAPVNFPDLWDENGVNFRIVRPDECTKAEKEAAMKIRDLLSAFSGKAPEITTDFLMPGEEYDAESFDILIGQTSYPESQQIMSESAGYDKYLVKTVGHKIVVFGWSDVSMGLAADSLGTVISGSNGKFPSGINVEESSGSLLDGMPQYGSDGHTVIYSMGDREYQSIIEKTTADEWRDYCKKLLGEGYELCSEREVNGNLFAQYLRSDVGIYTYFTPFNKTARIIIGPASNFSATSGDSTGGSTAQPVLTMIGRTFSQNATFRGLPANSGLMCFTLRLEDGRFIVIDGGTAIDAFADGIYNALVSQSADPNNIEIAAWIITHTHNDHTGGFIRFTDKYGSRVKIDELILNFPSDSTCREEKEDTNRKTTLNNFKRYYPSGKLTKVHSGELRNIGGAEIEFLYTQEDYYTSSRTFDDTPYWNNTSMIFSVTIAGQKIMFLGDSQVDSNGIAVRMYGSHLKSDICQVAHHGGEGGTTGVYTAIDPDVALFTTSDELFPLYLTDAHNAHLVKNLHVKEVINAANRITEFYLPYTVGTYKITDSGN
ncbi:MAG: MBL fold metallo-hydrolase [Eubacteriales bacterium]|nr:MBL fold metallo-hydrolase [Eubacteriales bacterium]